MMASKHYTPEQFIPKLVEAGVYGEGRKDARVGVDCDANGILENGELADFNDDYTVNLLDW